MTASPKTEAETRLDVVVVEMTMRSSHDATKTTRKVVAKKDVCIKVMDGFIFLNFGVRFTEKNGYFSDTF